MAPPSTCPSCRTAIPAHAASCPSCGKPRSTEPSLRRRTDEAPAAAPPRGLVPVLLATTLLSAMIAAGAVLLRPSTAPSPAPTLSAPAGADAAGLRENDKQDLFELRRETAKLEQQRKYLEETVAKALAQKQERIAFLERRLAFYEKELPASHATVRDLQDRLDKLSRPAAAGAKPSPPAAVPKRADEGPTAEATPPSVPPPPPPAPAMSDPPARRPSAPAARSLSTSAEEIVRQLQAEAGERRKAALVLVIDDAMGRALVTDVLPAFRTAIEESTIGKDGRLLAGVVVLTEKPYAALKPTHSLADLGRAFEKVAATTNEKFKNTLDVVRGAAAMAAQVDGPRAVVLYTVANGDTEDDLEGTVQFLRTARAKFYAITPEAVYSDHYWYCYRNDGTAAFDPAQQQKKTGFILHSEESAYLEFPFRWSHTWIGWKYHSSFGFWDGDSPLLIPSGFTHYGPARLARETGGSVFLAPSETTAPGFCFLADCPQCQRTHAECGAVYDEVKLKLTSPSLESRPVYLQLQSRDPLYRLLLKAAEDAHKNGMVSTELPLKFMGGKLVENKSNLRFGYAHPRGRYTPTTPWASAAAGADAQAKAAASVAQELRASLARIDRASANKRWLAHADALLFSIELSRMNSLQWKHFALERHEKGDAPLSETYLMTDVQATFCHGGKMIEDLDIYGGTVLRGEWKALCSLADQLIDRHRGTPWELLVRYGMVQDWEIAYKTEGTEVKTKRPKPKSGTSTTATPPATGTPTRPGRKTGSSGSSSTPTGN